MTFKEFTRWINDRAADGNWALKEARFCLAIYFEIKKLPFWKREKAWKQEREFMVHNLINPINERYGIWY